MSLSICLLLLTFTLGLAQQGGLPSEVQQLRVPRERIPPAPARSPEEALKTFKLPEGFRIEIVAAEPMVEAPVAASFDPDGRLWVLEMPGFMPNADGIGENEPVGRVSVLEDYDGDGRMDRRIVFIDRLVMARAMALVRGGLLVAEPPNLWFCRDTNGDGKADERNLVASDYAVEADPKLGTNANPEHSANGLFWSLDNWIYSANYTTRFRNVAGQWQRESTIFRGQWGLTQDDFGRLFFNSNSDHLRADLVPAHYLSRNSNYQAAGANVQIAKDQTVWPGRVNPGVNRGYEPDQLRSDGTLAGFTAACGPVIYRGDQFPIEFKGNAFVCEPAGNLIRRSILTEKDAVITASNAYDDSEFLTSSDERFRPVNLYNGPDGALYIVDMYRGIIQHGMYMTPYLRQQYLERGLDAPIAVGRIYRVLYKPNERQKPQPQLSRSNSSDLVKQLSHPNGWWRDTAQQLLVERADLSVIPQLQQLAKTPANPIVQWHALWTLDGLAQPDKETLVAAMSSPEPKVRAVAIRLSEPLLETSARTELLPRLVQLAGDASAVVRLQLALTLGELKEPTIMDTLARLLENNAKHPYIRDAVLSGLGGRELGFLEIVLGSPSWKANRAGLADALSALAKCVFVEGRETRINQLLNLISQENQSTAWRQIAMLDGILDTVPTPVQGRPAPAIRPVRLGASPPALAALNTSDNAEVRARAQKVDTLLGWPGKVSVDENTAKPLTPEQMARFQAGKDLYIATCGACHQPHGLGQEGLAPPLVDSEWVLGPESRLIRIALQGVRGPMTIKGKLFELEMPPLAVLDDEQIAAILTYIKREWGHTGNPVEPRTVAQIRSETETREEAWTETELLKIP